MPESNIQLIPPGVKKWYGPPVLTAYGCALLERFTGKSYTYQAINMETGAASHICRRTRPITAPEYDVICEKIRMSSAASFPDYCTDAKPGKTITKERLAEILEYIFSTIMPEHGYSYRAEQAALSLHILEAFCSGSVSLSDAGVGIGKTHAYLIASALVKRGRVNEGSLKAKYHDVSCISEMPVLVATSSIALQEAIAQDYIPHISRILQEHRVITKPLSCVIRKGKEHYICERRLFEFHAQTKRPEAKALVAPLLNRLHGADLDEMDSIDSYIKSRINVTGGCRNCPESEYCRYMDFMKDAKSDKYDFQICNHNYFLADVLRRSLEQSHLIPHYQGVVIDEAHKFIQAARQMYGIELLIPIIPRIADTISGFTFKNGQSVTELRALAKNLHSLAVRLLRVLVENIPENNYDDEAERWETEINSEAEQILLSISRHLKSISEMLGERQVLSQHRSVCYFVMRQLVKIREQIVAFVHHADLIYWLESPDGLYTRNNSVSDNLQLTAIPKQLGAMLCSALWSKGIPIALTSGTLSASGRGSSACDFTHVKLALGIDNLMERDVMETSKPSPFNYRENALIYISENVPFPDNRSEAYIEAITDEMERLIMAAHGHTAALFTSYRVMDKVFEKLKTRGLPFPLFMMGRGDNGAIERFRKSGNGVLLAAGSMWEGVDLPGDILSLLIIVKLPFAVPDPISKHERKKYGSSKRYKDEVIIPNMLVKLLQGFGRLLRNENDTGVVAILDFRVGKGKPYRKRVLEALPNCRVTSSIKFLLSFLISKKPASYFDWLYKS